MGILNDQEVNKWLTTLTKIIVAVITTVTIVLLLPEKTSGNYNYNYEIGKPWVYNTLIAEFKFHILRDKEDIEKDRQRLIETFSPYYYVDSLVENQALAAFRKEVARDTTGILATYSPFIERRLHFLYGLGIMDQQEYYKLSKDSSKIIRVIKDKIETPTEIVNVMAPDTAYERIFFEKELRDHRGLLSKHNLYNYVKPNLIYDKKHNDIVIEELKKSVPTSINQDVEKNEKIIERGEIVDEMADLKIKSLEQELSHKNVPKKNKSTVRWGQFIFVGLFILLFTCYLQFFRKDYYGKTLNIIMLYVLIAIFPIAVSLMVQYNISSIYILPFAMVPMITHVFFDSRTAFITMSTSVLISAMAANFPYEFIFMEMAGGTAAIYTLNDMSKRAHLFFAVITTTLSIGLIYYSIHIISSGTFDITDRVMLARIIISGVLLLLTYPLMYLIEKFFGFTSNITFFELSDTNQELLRTLSEKAPGTFAHSTTVGNLAAAVANRIGANALLVRTGALYHDIGKIENPAFFTENQFGVSVSPHNKLSEKESAKIIINHVTAGLKMAEKAGLPDVITDFIRTHHGIGMARFFYVQYKNKHPEEDVNPAPFTYPGPKPQTREQAILMMADAVEAATKSLKEYNDETISQKVNELIDSQLEAGNFEECPITFRDITMAKQTFIDRLKSLYHTRINYPQLNVEENKEKKEDEAVD